MNTIIVPDEIYQKCADESILFNFENFIFTEFMFELHLPVYKYDLNNKTDEILYFIDEYYKCYINQDKESININHSVHYEGKVIRNNDQYEWLYKNGKISEGRCSILTPRPEDIQNYSECNTVINFMGYIMQKGLDRQREYRKSGGRKYKYSREHRLSTSNNKIYLFDDIVNYVSEKYIPSKAHHEIQCPCWEVRGHYRHYKSGKVVFIPSYKKGKNKDKVEPIDKVYMAKGRT